MAGLYVLMTCVLMCIFFNKRVLSLILFFLTFALCWLMLWHHATNVLQVRW